jgi:hypothetical protein
MPRTAKDSGEDTPKAIVSLAAVEAGNPPAKRLKKKRQSRIVRAVLTLGRKYVENTGSG